MHGRWNIMNEGMDFSGRVETAMRISWMVFILCFAVGWGVVTPLAIWIIPDGNGWLMFALTPFLSMAIGGVIAIRLVLGEVVRAVKLLAARR
jgi:hypothetical protein